MNLTDMQFIKMYKEALSLLKSVEQKLISAEKAHIAASAKDRQKKAA